MKTESKTYDKPASTGHGSLSGAGDIVVVAVDDLSKYFGERCAVNNISFAIKPGECLGFLGPNGAGKSTTIHILLGLIQRTAG